jgi:lycopene cyclase CruA
MTIYLFYYQRADAVAAAVDEGRHPLLALYERFFTTLPRYKRAMGGEPLRMLRPTYGYIPAYTRLGPMPTAPSARVLLVGDAASRHSPLTFCGFGSMIRSFLPVSRGIIRCLHEDRLGRRDLDALWQGLDPPALQVMGGLTLMMMPPPGGTLEDPDGINDLLNAAFSALADLGQDAYSSFLRDEVSATTFIRFMRSAAGRYPAVYRKVLQHMTPMEAVTWVARLARFRAVSSRPPAQQRAVARRASGDNSGS